MDIHVDIGGKVHLTKEGLRLKLLPLGIKTVSGLNRFLLKHRDTFPRKGLDQTKPYFCEADVDAWLDRQVVVPVKRKRKKEEKQAG